MNQHYYYYSLIEDPSDNDKAWNPDVKSEDSQSTESHLLTQLSLQGLVFVNEYAIITTLGRGSFGEVKLALNTKDLEVYALKLISKTRQRCGGLRQKTNIAEASVMSEIDVMKDLSHPNLVRLVEVIGECKLQRDCNVVIFLARFMHLNVY